LAATTPFLSERDLTTDLTDNGDDDDDGDAGDKSTTGKHDTSHIKVMYLPVTDAREHIRKLFENEQEILNHMFGATRNPYAVAATTGSSSAPLLSSDSLEDREFHSDSPAMDVVPEDEAAYSLRNSGKDIGEWFFLTTIAVPPSRFRPGMSIDGSQSSH
jgi:DNA-directed RNA polymerase beta' subunit